MAPNSFWKSFQLQTYFRRQLRACCELNRWTLEENREVDGLSGDDGRSEGSLSWVRLSRARLQLSLRCQPPLSRTVHSIRQRNNLWVSACFSRGLYSCHFAASKLFVFVFDDGNKYFDQYRPVWADLMMRVDSQHYHGDVDHDVDRSFGWLHCTHHPQRT